MTTKWNTEAPEYFDWRLVRLSFDVRAAKGLLAAKKQLKVHNVSFKSIADQLLCMPPKEDGSYSLKIGGVTVDWDRVKADEGQIDLTVPILLAETKFGTMVIDGWHRIAKATLLGLETLPGVLLTKAETKKILV